MTKHHFKAEMIRLKEHSVRYDSKLIVPQMFLGGPVENGGFKTEWMQKWWNACNQLSVDDRELTELVEFMHWRKSENMINYYPTDKELKHIIREYREIQAMKTQPNKPKDEPQAKPVRRVRRGYTGKITCVDCQGIHDYNQMCPMMYPEAYQ